MKTVRNPNSMIEGAPSTAANEATEARQLEAELLEELALPKRNREMVIAALVTQSAADLRDELRYIGAGQGMPAFEFQVGIPRSDFEVGRIDVGANLPLLGDTPRSSDWEHVLAGEISVIEVNGTLELEFNEGDVALSPIVADTARTVFRRNAEELNLELAS